MIEIKTLDDIKEVRRKKTIENDLLDYLEDYLQQLNNVLEPETDVYKFSLERHGYFVVLEESDDIEVLKDVGLTEGLLGSFLEQVEKLNLGKEYYKIDILYNNEYMMIFYVPVRGLDKKVKRFLEKESAY